VPITEAGGVVAGDPKLYKGPRGKEIWLKGLACCEDGELLRLEVW